MATRQADYLKRRERPPRGISAIRAKPCEVQNVHSGVAHGPGSERAKTRRCLNAVKLARRANIKEYKAVDNGRAGDVAEKASARCLDDDADGPPNGRPFTPTGRTEDRRSARRLRWTVFPRVVQFRAQQSERDQPSSPSPPLADFLAATP